MGADIFFLFLISKESIQTLLLGVILAVGFIDVLYEVDEVFVPSLLIFIRDGFGFFVKYFHELSR